MENDAMTTAPIALIIMFIFLAFMLVIIAWWTHISHKIKTIGEIFLDPERISIESTHNKFDKWNIVLSHDCYGIINMSARVTECGYYLKVFLENSGLKIEAESSFHSRVSAYCRLILKEHYNFNLRPEEVYKAPEKFSIFDIYEHNEHRVPFLLSLISRNIPHRIAKKTDTGSLKELQMSLVISNVYAADIREELITLKLS